MTATIEMSADDLFEHAVALMTEHIDHRDEHVDDEVEYSLGDLTDYDAYSIDTIDEHNVYVFHGHIDGTVTKRTKRATRWQPPEYETKTIPIYVDLIFDPCGNDGLGTIEVVIDGEGNPFNATRSYDKHSKV